MTPVSIQVVIPSLSVCQPVFYAVTILTHKRREDVGKTFWCIIIILPQLDVVGLKWGHHSFMGGAIQKLVSVLFDGRFFLLSLIYMVV